MSLTSAAQSDTVRVPPGTARRVVIAVGIAHFINDAYSSFLSPLLPRLMTNLDISIAVAAGLAMTWSLAGSLVQPLAGYLADRYGRKLFVIGGPLISAIFLSLIGLAPSVEILARWASNSKHSRKLSPSRSITNVNTSPALPQP